MATPSSLRTRQQRVSTGGNPSTPRVYANANISTDSFNNGSGHTTPVSLSASVPFDWEAARNGGPPPYGNGVPLARTRSKGRKSLLNVDATPSKERQRVYRTTGWWERLTDLPARLLFDLEMLPQTLPLPPPKQIGHWLGLFCNVLHMMVTYATPRATIGDDEDDQDWSAMKAEYKTLNTSNSSDMEYEPWWYWSTLLRWLLIFSAFANAFYIFTRVKGYHLHHRKELVNSPNATFVTQDLDLRYKPEPPLWRQFLRGLGRRLVILWHFLVGTAPSEGNIQGHATVQRLDVWSPPEREMSTFIVYSPVHALLYPILGWGLMFYSVVLGSGLSILMYLLTSWFEQLVKDRAILASEVMYEYDQTFVYPRLNVVRKDACVMTNEAEIIDLTSSHRSGYSTQYDSPTQPAARTGQLRAFAQGEEQRGSPRTSIAPRKSTGRPKEVLRF